ncbi:4108_t:CDS:2 [Ambispora gerdemannii]|uniref:4108_t:CDS:1 n=1 Tax=Ambispora gerdemannii TaxID=144530 RepID=A0A9N8YUR6_9GLOM|nr:4108_t:CDS:2 [Ambispora gerdemannii]
MHRDRICVRFCEDTPEFNIKIEASAKKKNVKTPVSGKHQVVLQKFENTYCRTNIKSFGKVTSFHSDGRKVINHNFQWKDFVRGEDLVWKLHQHFRQQSHLQARQPQDIRKIAESSIDPLPPLEISDTEYEDSK